MVRALPSAIPSRMYRHFATVTLLLTIGIAMFADGENREALAAQVEEHEELRQESAEKPVKPKLVRQTPHHHHHGFRSANGGFEAPFGAPMDRALGSSVGYTTEVASDAVQAGYSDAYLSSLDPKERELLLKGLEREGLLSPGERERRSAALVAASHARSGGSLANY